MNKKVLGGLACAFALGAIAPATAPAAAEGAPTAEAKAAKKKGKPCANKNKAWTLCKPRAGTWRGVLIQDTPSGPESHPLEFTVERQGRNGTQVKKVDFGVPAWRGDIRYGQYWDPGPDPVRFPELGSWQPIPLSECADPSCQPLLLTVEGEYWATHWEKNNGEFRTDGEYSDFYFLGDFRSKSRANGKLWLLGDSAFAIRKVTWKASWAAKTPPCPPEDVAADTCG